MKDLKEALLSTRKPDITHVRAGVRTYIARACEYGSAKYERANFLRPTGAGAHAQPNGADFDRLRTYLRGMVSHTMHVLDAMEAHQASDPMLADVAGMQRAAYAADVDEGNAKVGPSGLPHLCGAFASGMMGLEQAIACGLLPADPGQTWAPAVVACDVRRAVVPVAIPAEAFTDLVAALVAAPKGSDPLPASAGSTVDFHDGDRVRITGGRNEGMFGLVEGANTSQVAVRVTNRNNMSCLSWHPAGELELAPTTGDDK